MNTKMFFEYFLWPILKIFWEPFSKKRSNFWHWENFNKEIPEEIMLFARMDSFAKSRDSFWSNLYQTSFGWKKTVVFIPKFSEGLCRIGFVCKRENKKQICQFYIIPNQKVALLRGPNHFDIFAVDESDNFIEIEFLEYLDKNKISKDTILL